MRVGLNNYDDILTKVNKTEKEDREDYQENVNFYIKPFDISTRMNLDVKDDGVYDVDDKEDPKDVVVKSEDSDGMDHVGVSSWESVESTVVNTQYKCEICGKIFTRARNLKRHQSVHTNVGNYKCEFCSKAFAENYLLQQHLLTHSGEKPYSCRTTTRPLY